MQQENFTRQQRPPRWPRIALEAIERLSDDGHLWVETRHHTTRPSIYTLYVQQPEPQPRKPNRHGHFFESALTRAMSNEMGMYIVRDRAGSYYIEDHWAWPPERVWCSREVESMGE